MSGRSRTQPSSSGHLDALSLRTADDIRIYKEQLEEKRLQGRELQKTLPLHRRGKTSLLHNPRDALQDTQLDEEDDEADLMATLKRKKRDKLGQALDQLAITTRDRRVERQQLNEYVEKKRELFLIKYALKVKREEMQRLEEEALAEEKKLDEAEKWLEADAAKFDKFLRENDRQAVAAIKEAELASQRKQEKASEIKKLQAELLAYKSEVSKQADKIAELRSFRIFLDGLSPKEWFEALDSKRQTARAMLAVKFGIRPEDAEKMAKRPQGSAFSRSTSTTGRKSARLQSPMARGDTPSSASASTTAFPISEYDALEDHVDLEVEPSLFFSAPAQLLHILEELEQNNLSLITNGQETEEALQELKERNAAEKQTLLSDQKVLEQQITALELAIQREEKETQTLKEKCKFFSAASAEEQEQELKLFDKKVLEVYNACIGDNEAGISTLQMLTNIENKLEELYEKMQKMPPDVLAHAEKMKDKERRQRLREEKIQAQRKHQEERMRRALERSKEGPVKRQGKKLMYRSQPPQKQKRKIKAKKQTAEEEERQMYFG